MGEIVVLVVEDSAVHQGLLAEAFKASGQEAHLVFHADAGGAWATIERMLYQARTDWPDFAIIDIGLPGMSGIELVDRIRQLRHVDGWPIVMLTASQDPDDRRESLLAKATGYFVKPTTAAGYRQLVGEILEFLGYDPEPPAAKAPARRTPSPGRLDTR
jgi:two-component system response regulator PhoP